MTFSPGFSFTEPPVSEAWVAVWVTFFETVALTLALTTLKRLASAEVLSDAP